MTVDVDVAYRWHTALVPNRLPVTGVYGLLLDGTGRCLIQVRADGSTHLPGGMPDPRDVDLFGTLRREAWEESQVVVTEVVHLGYQEVGHPGGLAYAHVGTVGRICRFEPRRPDVDGGQTYHRYLARLADVPWLLGWGHPATALAEAASRVATRWWRLPVDTPAAAPGYVD